MAANNEQLKAKQRIVKRRNIRRQHLPNCNPYQPMWPKDKEMTPNQRTSRTVHHIRKLTNQWFQCATKARNENIQAHFRKTVFGIKNKEVELWKDLVDDIIVDETRNIPPQVTSAAQEEERDVALKRRARDDNGLVEFTPNSDERKPKGRREKVPDTSRDAAHKKPTGGNAHDDDELMKQVAEVEENEGETDTFKTLHTTIKNNTRRETSYSGQQATNSGAQVTQEDAATTRQPRSTITLEDNGTAGNLPAANQEDARLATDAYNAKLKRASGLSAGRDEKINNHPNVHKPYTHYGGERT